MASSANRRSGHSRRAQYSTFFGYMAGLAGLCIGAALLFISIPRPQFLSGLRGTAADVTEPPAAAAAQGRAVGRDTVSTIEGYIRAAANYARLEEELEAAKVRLVEAEAVAEENRRLKRLLGIARNAPGPVAVTRITSSTATSTRRFATIGAGRRDGVAPGMPIRSDRGLVGRVLQVGERSSKVLLATDTESLVPVRRATDGLPAFAQGRGDGSVQIRLIDLGINPLKKGDVFVTSGSGGLYRPGVPVATVGRLLPDGAVAPVLSDPAATEYVLVEPVWAPEAAAWSESEPGESSEE